MEQYKVFCDQCGEIMKEHVSLLECFKCEEFFAIPIWETNELFYTDFYEEVS